MALPSPKILISREFDKPDDLETEWQNHYNWVLERCKNQNESQSIATLSSIAASSPESLQPVLLGLIYGILVDKLSSSKYLKSLGVITREQFAGCVPHMRKLILEKFHRLNELACQQCVWLTSSVISTGALESDSLLLALIRHIVTGNTSPKNLTLATQVLDICTSNRDWLYDQPNLIPVVVYTFTILIQDHHRPHLDALREREVLLVVQLIREKFDSCRTAGRDFIRVLYNISLIPEIKRVWDDVIMAPSAPGQPPNLRSLYHTPTPKHLLTSRITPEMETWLKFIFQNVKKGSQTRYQTWFAARYLSTQENENLIPEIIRWICGVHHPSNAILQSDIVPRFMILGWLLTFTKIPRMALNARQALLYDWFFFVPGKDNIMNIEPAVLLIMRSIPQYVQMTSSLAEHLMTSIDGYLFNVFPQAREDIKRGIYTSARILIDKKVVPSYEPLYNCPQIAQPLRDAVKKIFEGVRNKPVAGAIPPSDPSQQAHHHHHHQQLQTQQQQSLNAPPANLSQSGNSSPASSSSLSTSSSAPNSPYAPTSSPSSPSPFHQVPSTPSTPSSPSVPSSTLIHPGPSSAPSNLQSTTHSPTPPLPNGMSHPKRSDIPNTESHDSLAGSTPNNVSSPASSPRPINDAPQQQNSPSSQMEISEDDDESLFQGWKAAVSSAPVPSQQSMDDMADQVLNIQARENKLINEKLEPFQEQLASLKKSTSDPKAAQEAFSSLLSLFLQEIASVVDVGGLISALASALIDALAPELLSLAIIPCVSSNFSYNALFTALVEAQNDEDEVSEHKLVALQHLFSELRTKEPSFGYRFICYLLESQKSMHWANPELYIKNLSTRRHEEASSDESSQEKSFELFSSQLRSIEAQRSAETRKQNDLISATWISPYTSCLKYCNGKRKVVKDEELENLFCEDMLVLAQNDLNLFNELVPHLCRYWADLCVGSKVFVKLVISNCLPSMIHYHMTQLTLGTYELIGDQLSTILIDSLEWDSFSQLTLWKIVEAEFALHPLIVTDAICGLIPILKPFHFDALSGVQSALANLAPTKKLLEALLSSPIALSSHVVSILVRWSREEERDWLEKLIKFITQSLNSLSKGTQKKNQIRTAIMHLSLWCRVQNDEFNEQILSDDKLKKLISSHLHAACPEPEFSQLSDMCKDSNTAEVESEEPKPKKVGGKKRSHQEMTGSDDEAEEESKTKAKRRKLKM